MKSATPVVMAAAALLPTLLVAQGPDPALLPADTAFVAHVDVQRLGALIGLDDLLSDPDAREVSEILERIESVLGFAPLRGIRSVTLFGSDVSAMPGVMVIADESLDEALDVLDEEGASSTERAGGMRFQRIGAAGLAAALGFQDVDASDSDSVVLYVQRIRNGRRAVLIGERAEDLVAAARVLDGEEESMQQAGAGNLDLRSSSDSIAYLEVSTSLEAIMRETPASALASKIRGLALDLSEARDDVEIRLTAATASRQDASDVQDLINGLRGLVSLAGDVEDVPEAVRGLVEGLRAEAEGDRVTVRLSVPLREVRRLLEEALK